MTVMKVRALVKTTVRRMAEKKTAKEVGADTIVTLATPIMFRKFAALAQGVTAAQHIGSDVTLTGMRFDFTLWNGDAVSNVGTTTNVGCCTWRVLVLEVDELLVIPADIFEDYGTHGLSSKIDRAVVKKVYYDRKFNIDSVAARETGVNFYAPRCRHVTVYPRIFGKVQFEDAAGTDSDRNFYVLFFNTGVVAAPQNGLIVEHETKLYYTDT